MKTPRSAFTAIAGSLALVFASCALPEPPDRVALVYGVSIYDDSYAINEGPNLSLADDDATSMSGLLDSQGWQVELSVNEAATKLQIAADIAQLKAEGFDGQVLLYYSGHGGIDPSNGKSVFCPRGSWDSDLEDWVLENMIYPDELFTMFHEAGLKHVIVILDSCNSGGFVDPGATTDGVPPLFGPNEIPDGSINYGLYLTALGDAISAYASYASYDNVIVLSAAGADDFSWESGTHGIFTFFVLQAPDKADSDGDGVVTTTELYSFTAANIQTYWNAIYGNDPLYYSAGQWADFHPHVTGSPREYAIFKSTK